MYQSFLGIPILSSLRTLNSGLMNLSGLAATSFEKQISVIAKKSEEFANQEQREKETTYYISKNKGQ